MPGDRSRNFKLVVEYDGGAYHGWQRQTELPTVQACIEAAIASMVGRSVVLIGSGRTDAGVHALGQTANFRCTTRISPVEFQKGLNALLPADIVIKRCDEAAPDFHARYDVAHKTYRYQILNRPIAAAVGRQYAWFIRSPLDWPAMEQALGYIRGRHDFKAFEGAGSPRSHTVREVLRTQITQQDDLYFVEITANGFLRFMVRNIVGTLAAIGRGRMRAADIPNILASEDRRKAAATAPAHGLFLVSVAYGGDSCAAVDSTRT